jgi:hypothetical protein
MRTHRHFAVVLAAALVTCLAAAVDGRQIPRPPNAPARPGMPVRDPGADRPIAVGTASVSGTVTVAGSGVPARRARVTLSGADLPARHGTTDEHGRFTFAALPAGRYSLSASKPGHVAAHYGQPSPGRPGTPIQLGDGQKFAASLQISRGGVLTGTVLDEAGEAIPGTQVRALRFVLQYGERTLRPAGSGATDDRGIYRIYGLDPGEYIVAATPRNPRGGPNIEALRSEAEALRQRAESFAQGEADRSAAVANRLATLQAAIASEPEDGTTGYAPVYYPGTTALAQATSTTIGPGEERSGLDFQLQRVAVARIEGVVVNPTGQPLQNIQITLTDLNQSVPAIGNSSTRANDDGQFRFSNVAPGQYRISARATVGARGRGRIEVASKIEGRAGRGAPPSPPPTRLWGSADISVDGRDYPNVALSLQEGVSMSGRVVFQGSSLQPPTDLSRIRVNLTAANPAGPREPTALGRADASGRFTITSIVPGRYRVNVGGLPEGWVVESAIVEGQDALDFPFEVKSGQAIGSAVVTLTDRRAELTGTLVDVHGQPAPGYTLLLYPSDQRYWLPQSRRIRTTRPATDGQFMFATVPPGDYKLVPVGDVEPGSWFDPAFLQHVDSAALRVSITEGEKKVQNVRLAGQ